MCTARARRALVPCISLLLVLLAMLHPVHASEQRDEIRLAIISIASPSKVYKQWAPFSEYLSRKSGHKVKLVVPKGFKKIQQAIEEKSVDLFYVNSHIFYRLKQSHKAEPIAQMINLNGMATSKSVLFVRNDSGINSLQDLKGQSIAFVSPMGAGGYLAPRAEFYQHGIKTPSDTHEQFTKNLTSSIHKVLIGDAKAGTMCGLNYALLSKRLETGDLKIVAETSAYPENVIGARVDMDIALHNKLRSIIVGMQQDKEGNKILQQMQSMKILRFDEYDEKIEDLTRSLIREAEFK